MIGAKTLEADFEAQHPGELIALLVSGSHAHGLAHAESDFDLRGVYSSPARAFWGLQQPPEQVVTHDPDTTVFELRKFCWLAAVGNPNIVELLFTPAENVILAGEEWGQMVAMREAFLSRSTYENYIGYAKAQLYEARRLAAGGPAVHRWKEGKRRKHLRHVFRVVDEAEQLFASGELSVRVRDAEGLMANAARPVEEVAEMLTARIAGLEAMACPFPEQPSWAAIEDFLAGARERQLERERRLGEPSWNLGEVDYEARGWPRPRPRAAEELQPGL